MPDKGKRAVEELRRTIPVQVGQKERLGQKDAGRVASQPARGTRLLKEDISVKGGRGKVKGQKLRNTKRRRGFLIWHYSNEFELRVVGGFMIG